MAASISKKASSQREDSMAQNAPNKPTDDGTTRNYGGKVETGKNEGGTKQDPADALEKKESKEGDRIVLTSSVNEEEAAKVKENPSITTEPINFTKSLTGVPGNVDLTQGGRLAGDKSVRVKKTIEEINEELEKTSGPNPAPNREGNELLKATNAITGIGLVDIDTSTNAMADDLKEMLKKDSFGKEDKEKLKGMEERLRLTGSVA